MDNVAVCKERENRGEQYLGRLTEDKRTDLNSSGKQQLETQKLKI